MSTMSEVHAEARGRCAVLLPMRRIRYFRLHIVARLYCAFIRRTGRCAYLIGG